MEKKANTVMFLGLVVGAIVACSPFVLDVAGLPVSTPTGFHLILLGGLIALLAVISRIVAAIRG